MLLRFTLSLECSKVTCPWGVASLCPLCLPFSCVFLLQPLSEATPSQGSFPILLSVSHTNGSTLKFLSSFSPHLSPLKGPMWTYQIYNYGSQISSTNCWLCFLPLVWPSAHPNLCVSPHASCLPWNTTSSPWFYLTNNSSIITSCKRHFLQKLLCNLVPMTLLLWGPFSPPFVRFISLYFIIDSVILMAFQVLQGHWNLPTHATIRSYTDHWKSHSMNPFAVLCRSPDCTLCWSKMIFSKQK